MILAKQTKNKARLSVAQSIRMKYLGQDIRTN